MCYVILDSSGNLIESFDQEPEARAVPDQIVREEPEAAEHVALLAYDDHGEPVGDAITISAPTTTR